MFKHEKTENKVPIMKGTARIWETQTNDIFFCDCSSHAIQVSVFKDGTYPQFDITLWAHGDAGAWKPGLWERVKNCFRYMFWKKPFNKECVILNQELMANMAMSVLQTMRDHPYNIANPNDLPEFAKRTEDITKQIMEAEPFLSDGKDTSARS